MWLKQRKLKFPGKNIKRHETFFYVFFPLIFDEADRNFIFTLNKFKGEYEDYTWGYKQNPLDYPLPLVPFSISSVDPSQIP